jgi:hypothetical protein
MAILLVHRKLAMDLVINAAQVGAQVLGFSLGYFLYGSLEAAVAGICICGGIVHVVGLILIHDMLKQGKS